VNCGESITTIALSDTVLSKGTAAFNILAAGGDCTLPLDRGITQTQLGNLAAQTLALNYNVQHFSGFGAQTLGAVGCLTPEAIFLGFTSGTTLNMVRFISNLIIDRAENGAPLVTRQQVTRMNMLLGGCVNQIGSLSLTGLQSAWFASSTSYGFPLYLTR